MRMCLVPHKPDSFVTQGGNAWQQETSTWSTMAGSDTEQVGLGLASLCKRPQLGDRGVKFSKLLYLIMQSLRQRQWYGGLWWGGGGLWSCWTQRWSQRLVHWWELQWCSEIGMLQVQRLASWTIFNLFNSHLLPSSVPDLTSSWPLGKPFGMRR